MYKEKNNNLLQYMFFCRPSGRDNAVKLKAMNETVLRLNKANEQLQMENRALKDDLKNALEDSQDKRPSSKFFASIKKYGAKGNIIQMCTK